MRSGTTLNDFMHWDNTLFDGVVLHPELDHGRLVSEIMFRCGLQNPLYEHYDVFKEQVHNWFWIKQWNINRLVRLINEEYNPLWNKDGTQTIERTVHTLEDETTAKDVVTANTGTENRQEGGTETDTMNYNSQVQEVMDDDTTHTANETNTHSVKGFNATDWQETDRDTKGLTENATDDRTTTQNKTGADTGSKQFGKTDTLTLNTNVNTDDDTQRNLEGTQTETVTQKDFGNIGVTMSQDMFEREYKLLHDFNIYQFIAKMFDDELMLGVYTY